LLNLEPLRVCIQAGHFRRALLFVCDTAAQSAEILLSGNCRAVIIE